MTTATEPRFLFPQSRQYPFDEVCEQIVHALEERGWDIPGLSLDFDVYGSGAEKYRLLRAITGDNFRLRFGRPQGRLGHWNDTAAISEIQIPRMELSVYDDESGPTLTVYVGRRWTAHKERFFRSIKVNSKLRGEPRKYLRYKGGCNCQSTRGANFEAIGFLLGDAKSRAAMNHTHTGCRAPYLIHDNDLGREYAPKGREPKLYNTEKMFARFTQYLTDTVLPMILAAPLADATGFFQVQAKPWTDELSAHVGPIYCFGENRDAERVRQGKLDADELEPGNRYAFSGGGYRLASLGVPNDGSVPKVAYDGFKWCTLGEVMAETPIDTLDVPGHYRWSDKETFVFRVSPNRVDGVYVADHAPYDKRREELFEEIKPRDTLTDAELNQALQARARTIMPIVEYALMTEADPSTAYEQPIVLINRELDFDEVELVSGPWPECQYVQIIANRSPEARTLLEDAIAAQEVYYQTFSEDTRQLFHDTVAKLSDHFMGDEELTKAAQAYSKHTFHKVELNPSFLERLVSAATEARRLGLF